VPQPSSFRAKACGGEDFCLRHFLQVNQRGAGFASKPL
jgi:hypothetical protein